MGNFIFKMKSYFYFELFEVIRYGSFCFIVYFFVGLLEGVVEFFVNIYDEGLVCML